MPDAAVHLDVAIIGAGISGIGSARQLKACCPWARFLVLEALDEPGGTWVTNTYPGIRSDSDLYTFGYRFKPWTSAPIATGAEICRYIHEVIKDEVLEGHIRYRHRLLEATWSTRSSCWFLKVRAGASAELLQFRADFLWMCQGYFRHSEGYVPDWPGRSDFKGPIIHPQVWPKDAPLKNNRVVVIGSGATAATLVPNIADVCSQVTLIQRSPTFFISGKNVNELADTLRSLEIDERWIHEIVRRQILRDQEAFIRRCRDQPDLVRDELIGPVREYLGSEIADKHFTPRYRPWRQRIAVVPNGDLFTAIKSGRVLIKTAEIDRITAQGVRITSGEIIEADVIISATGFNLCVMGDVGFTVDETPINFADTVTYRGVMFTGVPNLAYVFGYLRASWTLRVELVADFVCKLLRHMRRTGASQVEVALAAEEERLPKSPWIDPEDFNPGYLRRSQHLLPKALSVHPWRHSQDYAMDCKQFPIIDFTGREFRYKAGRTTG